MAPAIFSIGTRPSTPAHPTCAVSHTIGFACSLVSGLRIAKLSRPNRCHSPRYRSEGAAKMAPRNSVTLTIEQEREIIALYRSGTSLNEIKPAYELHNDSRIYAILRRHHEPTRTQASKALD